MKKMFFTAIALVAFTGVSMANTKEIKKPTTSTKETTKTVVVITPCQETMLDAYEFIIDNIRGGKEDWTLLNNLLSNCK